MKNIVAYCQEFSSSVKYDEDKDILTVIVDGMYVPEITKRLKKVAEAVSTTATGQGTVLQIKMLQTS